MIRSSDRFADTIDFTACALGPMRVSNRPEDTEAPPSTRCQFQLPLEEIDTGDSVGQQRRSTAGARLP